MASVSFKMWVADKYLYKDGYAIWLVVRKENKRKVLSLGLYALPHQWDENAQIYTTDKRTQNLHPDRVALNQWINTKKVAIQRILDQFERDQIDWTLNQFEDAFFNYAKKGRVNAYFDQLIATLKETGHHGNASCYSSTAHILSLYDPNIEERVFAEIDIKFVKAFDIWLQKRGCGGNTRKYYHKALRACLNKAIQDKEASASTYPYGKGGFNTSALEEQTPKRYLTASSMAKLKTTAMDNLVLERARRLFLLSYYCYGIAYVDMALLTTKNIATHNGGRYIVYKRNKTKEAKRVKPIQIKITDEIQEQLDWFARNTVLVGDYLTPLVSRDYKGEQLYKHIRNHFSRHNSTLKELAAQLDITDMKLTSYVSRHTMAMTLQENNVPREVIAQILGHSDLNTTNTYLDSFGSSVIDQAAKVL